MVSILLFGQLTIACKKNTKIAPPPPPPVIEEPAPEVTPDPEPPVEVKELVANFQRVYFDYDASELSADSVVQHLIAAGISSNRLKTVSYGEERPLSQGGSEQAWSKNRRCEFVIVWGGEPAATTPAVPEPIEAVDEPAE